MSRKEEKASLIPPGALRDMGLSLTLAVGMAAVCHAMIAEARFIPSLSMAPTLEVGDRLVIEKLTYHVKNPHRGDIVVFKPPSAVEKLGYLDTSIPWIKRVIGLPGETVEIVQGQVLINKTVLREPYLSEAPDYDMPPAKVPAGQIFVLGDNRNHSVDSHIWGPVPLAQIIGRASFRFWPPKRFGDLAPSGAAVAMTPVGDRL